MKIVKKLQGIVVKLSNANTASVEVSRKVAHPKYNKLYIKSNKHLVDFEGELAVGDFVEISSIKPVSKMKSFKVTNVIKKAKQLSQIEEAI